MGINYKSRLARAARILFSGQSQFGSHARIDNYTVPAITEEEIAEAKMFFPMEKFFIFGHARSGTTLLTRLVRLHPNVHCNYQGHFFTRPPLLQSLVADPEITSWLTRRSNRWNRGEDLSPVILRAAADFIMERDARRIGKNIVGDKSPNSLLNGKAVNLLSQVYPDGRLIYIVRDGRDALVSHRFQTFIDGTQHLNKEDWRIREAFINDPESFTNSERSIFTEKGLRRACERWENNVTETEERGKSLFGDQFYALRYEDLLENSVHELRNIWIFLSAGNLDNELDELIASELNSNPDADWQREKAGEIASSLQKGARGSWVEYFTPADHKVFESIAGVTLKKWGYL
jgi:hypothetical protein